VSWVFAGHILLGSAQIANYIYRLLKPHRVGIYGPSMVGKTTLDQYLTVPGDIDPIPEELRTTHAVKNGSFQMPHSSKKQVRWKGERIPIATTDIGGQQRFWNMWAEDMVKRNVSVIFYVVDHRLATSPFIMQEAVAGFKYLTDIVVKKKLSNTFSRRLRKKVKKYKPSVVCLVLNKMDLWWDEQANTLWDWGLERQHPLVEPFKEDMRRLRRASIATNVEAMAAQYGLRVESAVINTIHMI